MRLYVHSGGIMELHLVQVLHTVDKTTHYLEKMRVEVSVNGETN